MTSPRDDDRIDHIVDACEQATSFIAGKTRDDLEHDRMLQLALVKLVEIIGEAAKAVSEDTRHPYPDVPWSLAAPHMRSAHPPLPRSRPRRALEHRDREPSRAACRTPRSSGAAAVLRHAMQDDGSPLAA